MLSTTTVASNAGGKSWTFANAIDNILNTMPRSSIALIPMRVTNLGPTHTSVGMRQKFLPSSSIHGQDVNASRVAGAIAPVAIPTNPGPPQGGCTVSPPNVGLSSAPVFHHKIREVEVFVVEAIPHIRYFRHWRLRFFKQVAAESVRGDTALAWIKQIEIVSSIEELVETDPNWINF